MPYLTEIADIQSVISEFASRRVLWIDTEVAEWWTPQPKLSLIQVLDNLEDLSGNKTYVLDVLARPELVENFFKKIMLNPNIEKVFHNASYDLRFLGRTQATKVTCTLLMANKLKKQNRLSLPNLQLKTLAVELCNFSNVDTEEGKSKYWGQRPLTNKQLRYAQMDPVYLAQVHRHLLELTYQSHPPVPQKTILKEQTSNYTNQIKSVGDLTNQNDRQPKPLPSSANPPLLILIDGQSLAYRSYYAFAKGQYGGLRTKIGIPTSVCFGFLNSLLAVIKSEQPHLMAVAFDLGFPTFRHKADDAYNANKPEIPADLITDLHNVQELLVGLRVPIITSPGYEVDDILATLALQGSKQGYRVKILTGDRDLFQLVDSQKEVSVLYLSTYFLKGDHSSEPTEFDSEQVKDKLGITPTQIVDFKALCGDKSDNIPGVKGIGDKTAISLLHEYGTLDGIYTSLDKIKGAVKKKLEAGKQDAEHSRYLAQLAFDVPVNIALEECKLKEFNSNVIKSLLEKLELSKFQEKLEQLQHLFEGKKIEKSLTKTSSSSPQLPENDPDLKFFSIEDPEKEYKQIWSDVLNCIQRRTVQTLLRQHGHLISVSPNIAKIAITSEPLLQLAQRELPYVEAAFQKVCDRQVQVILQVGTQPERKTTPADQQSTPRASNATPLPKAN